MKSAFIKTGWLYALSLVGYLSITYFIKPHQYELVVLNYLLLFLLFALSIWFAKSDEDIHLGVYAAIVFRLSILFALPSLSDDFYRFVWDGRIMLDGFNPFLHLPSELHRDPELFAKLNSPDYYSVYPPVPQSIFYFCTKIFPTDLLACVVSMKVFVFAFEVGSIILLRKILLRFKLPAKNVLLYALNPLVIVELCGNLHFEAGMIFFTLGCIYFLVKNKPGLAGMALGLSILTKLNPILFVPFLFFRMNWKAVLLFILTMSVTLVVLFIPFYSPEVFDNIFSSLRKYYQQFEFNGSIYNLIRWWKIHQRGWNPIDVVGRNLALATLLLIGALAIFDFRKSLSSLPSRMMFALFVFLLLGTTVHPWYLTPIVALSVLTNYRFAVIWSVLVSLTYLFYTDASFEIKRLILWLEYVMVIGAFLYELFVYHRFFREAREWSIFKRANIKLKRILPFLTKDEKVLDIGCGNGGVYLGMKHFGVALQAVDIKNRSAFEEVSPIIYSGQKLPFEDKSFDTTTIITVLHHINDPVETIREAKRVSNRILIMEDIYVNSLQKRLTFWIDSLVNLEFKNHPHSNMTDKEWRNVFEREGLEIADVKYHRALLLFRQVTYLLNVSDRRNAH